MKPYVFALIASLCLSTTLFGHFESAKYELKDLKFNAKMKSMLFGYDAYYSVGQYDAYTYALLVINMWERRYTPKKPPKFKMKTDLLVLMAISNEKADEGFEFVEDSWSNSGFRNGITRSISIIEGKPYVGDGLYH